MSASHQNLGDLLAHPNDFNFADRPGAISHYRLAVKIEEDLAAADLHDVHARVDLANAYRNFGAILLEERPAESLKLYQEATAISETLAWVTRRIRNTVSTLHSGKWVSGNPYTGSARAARRFKN